MRAALIALILAAPAALDASPGARDRAPDRKRPEPAEPRPAAQKEADRLFKSGVALFKDARYAEALAEFERAYRTAPHPLVLYNIASCHRELARYADAVTTYSRFLADGPGKVPAARITAAQAELDALLRLVARVTVTITPAVDGAALIVDGAPLSSPAMPLILTPGEHRLVARAAGRPDVERVVQALPGDVVTVDLAFAPLEIVGRPPVINTGVRTEPPPAARRRFALGLGFGTNLRLIGDTGAPALGLAAALGGRFELGVDAVLVAYAVVPAIRVRVAGEALALHAVAAAPIAFTDGPMSERFVAGAIGLGLRYRPTPGFALRLESYASFAGEPHGTTLPTFLGGELWF